MTKVIVEKANLDAALAEPAVEPVAWMVRNGLVACQVMVSKTQADAIAAEMQTRHDLSGSWAAFRVHPLFASPPPADVPLLTQDDIVQIILSSKHLPLGEAIRLTEKVVRQKAGL